MKYVRDPLFTVSVVLAILGAIQASQGLLTPLIQQYPVAFGLTMTGISCVTAALTVLRTRLQEDAKGSPPERDA